MKKRLTEIEPDVRRLSDEARDRRALLKVTEDELRPLSRERTMLTNEARGLEDEIARGSEPEPEVPPGWIVGEFRTSFDLEEGPLTVVVLADEGTEQYLENGDLVAVRRS